MITNTEAQNLLDQFQEWIGLNDIQISSMSRDEVYGKLFDLAGGNEGNPPGLLYPERGHMYSAYDYLLSTNFFTHKKPNTMKTQVEPLLPPGVGDKKEKFPDEPTTHGGRVAPYISPMMKKYMR